MLEYCPRKDVEVPDLREYCKQCSDNPCWYKKLKFQDKKPSDQDHKNRKEDVKP